MNNPPNLNYINKLFNNKKIKKIVNVYQKKYINCKAQGFGDFLRGSIYLTYICKVLNLDFDIDLSNHPMAKHLIHDKNTNTNNKIDYDNIYAYIDYYNTKDNEFIFIFDFINKLNKFNKEIMYVFVNYKPLFDIECPEYGIINEARDIIIPKIEPKKSILDILESKLTDNNLIIKNYAVIHIRCGDYFMNIQKNVDSEKHQISKKHVNDIIKFIRLYCNKDKKYILIGDSNQIKLIIKQQFSNIIMFDTSITHLGEDENPSDKSLIETLMDFNIMRYSNHIISLTAYGHGSGFSKYCSVIYDIPFKQIILEPTLKYLI
jgi:hypothetical protein